MSPARCWIALALALPVGAAACVNPARFSVPNAQRHIRALAGDIGSRPSGSEANRRARELLLAELGRYGFDVRIQQATVSRPEFGRTAFVANIIAVKAGARPEAVALVSHYDSPPDSRGAADDALGVAVCVEAGRVLAMRPNQRWSLVVVLTDAEEYGLMGAAALVRDPVMDRIKAYFNYEAVGSGSPAMLFQTGPGNGWLLRTWAAAAPRPDGASFADAIYQRLPNDTDFTVLARTGTPGLNFATIGDSYSYHTARDIPDRLDPRAVEALGENTIAAVEALDAVDITQRTADSPAFFSLLGRVAIVLPAGRSVFWLALAVGLLAWLATLMAARREPGLLRVLVTASWTMGVTVFAVLAMVGAAWLRRAGGWTLLQPWYARPRLFFLFVGLTGVVTAWLLTQVLAILPARARGSAHPVMVWAIALPVWLLAAMAAQAYAPAAAYLCVVPLLITATLLLVALALWPSIAFLRVVSMLALVAVGLLWLESAVVMLDFSVPMLGRLPVIVPIYLYPVILALPALWFAPPIIAAISGFVPAGQPRILLGVGLCLACLGFGYWSEMAPAYSLERPQYRSARYVLDTATNRAIWEVSGNERMFTSDVGEAAGMRWQRLTRPQPLGLPVGASAGAFVYRAYGRPTVVPVSVVGTSRLEGQLRRIEIDVRATRPLYAVSVVMPPGVTPVEPSHPGVLRERSWTATLVAPPEGGLVFRAIVPATGVADLSAIRVVAVAAGLPGGEGWQGLPRWLPRERATWFARSFYIVPALVDQQPGTSTTGQVPARLTTTGP